MNYLLFLYYHWQWKRLLYRAERVRADMERQIALLEEIVAEMQMTESFTDVPRD